MGVHLSMRRRSCRKGRVVFSASLRPQKLHWLCWDPLRGLRVKMWKGHTRRDSSITSAPSSSIGAPFDSGLILLNHKLSFEFLVFFFFTFHQKKFLQGSITQSSGWGSQLCGPSKAYHGRFEQFSLGISSWRNQR